MAADEHVEEVNSNENEKSTRKIEKTILDNFSNLVKPQEKVRIRSSVNLIKYLVENEENANELKYALGRIIRGLGSSTVSARTGFYTALVGLINTRDDISVTDIFNHLEKELHKAGSNTKGENADIYLGQILTCGAIMRSELWSRCSEEEQKRIIELLLKNSKERIYLSLVAYNFITDKFKEMNERDFKKTFQIIKETLSKPWAEQNIDSLYLLLCVKNKNSSYVNNKFLQKTVGTKDIICPKSLEELCSILMTIPRVTFLKHPIYEIIGKDLAVSEHLIPFVQIVDANLQRPNRNKQLIATKIYSIILQNVQNLDSVPQILTKNFIQQTLNYFKTFKGKNKDAEFQQSTNKFFETLLETLKRDGAKSQTKIAVLKKLLFYPGTFIFEKITRSKVIQQITYSLDNGGVKMLATLYEGVIKGTEKIDSEDARNENWLNNDRLYAAHLLIKLLSHASMKDENEWKTEKLGFLMHLGLFRMDNGANIGSELAASLKTAFFGSLDMKLLKLEDIQTILSRLVRELDSKLTPDNLEIILRNPIPAEQYETWQKTIQTITKIEKKKKKGGLRSVFLTLFLHMGMQLFNDANLASDSLKELFLCYEKTRKNRTNSESTDETEERNDTVKTNDPAWIEVVADLFLNLLSHNSHLLRTLIKCVFPHLCRYMTPATIHQILSVIDPKNEDNPLSKRNDNDEDDDENNEEENESDPDEKESEEEEDLEDVEDESVNDRLRMALHKVLTDNGYQSDEESVDLDKLSDTEGEKLDEALAEAFKQFRPNHGRRKKQNKDQETLTHFRVRVLDLIDIYLDSTPSMILALEIMLPLLQAVEFSIRDQHQKPLHDRLKSCLKKLSSLKKFSDTDGVDETVLGNLLGSLLEKGTKNSLIIQDMGVQIADCCIFIVRCADLLMSLEATPKKMRKHLKNSITGIVRDELQNYFHKRDCLTPYVLFKNAIQLTWDGTLTLVPLLLDYVFSDDVKPFKKNQALELLRLFYANHRYLSTKPEKIKKKLSEEHSRFAENVNNLFKSLCDNPERAVKEKFISGLFNVLATMKTSRLNIEINWEKIAENVREYRSFVTFSKDAKSSFNRLCNHLNVSHLVKMKPKTVNISVPVDEDENSENEGTGKPDKKKKKKTKNKEKLKLKKEAKELRLSSLSEGFKDLDFAAAKNVETSENEGEEEKNDVSDLNGDIKGTKKRKKSGKSQEQEQEGRKTAKKKKNEKDTSESSLSATNGSSNERDNVNKRKGNEDTKLQKKKKVLH
ncbi:myb-binding protein 1A-like protein [Anoplophora glabripennis]|uniref:myb-binding protein 1A-like protein n=1 Tax=Anoplophora glabripennis TaxID=217634 RepID=UPI0008747B09|nr:myb-binding protein 1A-like protein [Anoplophora glabripennis]